MAATTTFNLLGDVTLFNTVSGPGGITKSGAGTLILSGNNTFAGPLDVLNGTVASSGNIQSQQSRCCTGSTDTASFNQTGGLNTVAGDVTVGNSSSSNGTLNINAGGSVSNSLGLIGLAYQSTGQITVAGGTSTNSGLLAVGYAGDGTLIISAGGSVTNANGRIGNEVFRSAR